ncbi:MAG: hypothetical protein HYY34_08150 [Chloroflexi bacterium]|nr:hypothetical protein [Chloroflexota bacterium]
MTQRFAAVVASVVIIGAAACGSKPPTPTPSPVAAAPRATPTAAIGKNGAGQTEIKIYLSEATGQYQTGSATITDLGGKTQVLVNVAPAMANAQPIHIHIGTCDAVGTISDKLENVVVGKSVTEIDRPLAEIAAGGKVVNVHLSASEIRTYTACGEIPALKP